MAHTEAHAARRLRRWAALAACCAGLAAGAGADELKPFTARYSWTWHGMNVAVTTVRLEQHGDNWQYSSQSAARGIGRMLSLAPKTVSVLQISGAEVQPLSYQGDDGSGSSKRTVNVTYDWQHQRVTGVYEDTPVDLALTPGVQDDSSIQIALMAALLHGRTPGPLQAVCSRSAVAPASSPPATPTTTIPPSTSRRRWARRSTRWPTRSSSARGARPTRAAVSA